MFTDHQDTTYNQFYSYPRDLFTNGEVEKPETQPTLTWHHIP